MVERNQATEDALNDPDNRFVMWRLLDDGTYIALGRLAFTVGLFIGVEPLTPFKRRYCYKDLGIAFAEYMAMDTGDYVPTGWVARRPETEEDKEAKSRPGYDPSVFWPKRGNEDDEVQE